MSVVKAPKNPVADWEQVRDRWVAQVADLVDRIEQWARELGWATRRIDKPMQESRIGEYTLPGLVLQEGFAKVMLEPVARFVPGADGVVDLYLMPAWDDIASLFLYGNEWRIRPGRNREPETLLTRESLAEVFRELTTRAA